MKNTTTAAVNTTLVLATVLAVLIALGAIFMATA